MQISYTREVKAKYANDRAVLHNVENKVRSIISGIASAEGEDSTQFTSEVTIYLQPRPDGSVSVMGWLPRPPVKGIPDPNYDEEYEIIPVELEVTPEMLLDADTKPPKLSPFEEKALRDSGIL